jgi:sugar phosphate isomerase/epimerase
MKMRQASPTVAAGERIGINCIGRRPVEESLRVIKELGYAGVDYSAGISRLAADGDALARIRNLTRDLGLIPAATHTRSFGTAFLAPGEAHDAFLRESVEDVRLAAFLGVRAVAFHVAKQPANQDPRSDGSIAAANAEVFRTAVEVAEQEGVYVALENHFRGFGERWEQLEMVASLLDSPAVGFTLDSGHAVVAGQDPAALARLMGARLHLTHLHDNHGTADTHRPAGRYGIDGGETGPAGIDWPSLIAALREIGYPERNVWMLEGGLQIPGDDADRLLATHIACFRPFLA